MCIPGSYLMKALPTQEVMNTRAASEGRKGVVAGVTLRQRLQQRLGLLQVGGIPTLGAAAIDRRQQLADFSSSALVLPPRLGDPRPTWPRANSFPHTLANRLECREPHPLPL